MQTKAQTIAELMSIRESAALDLRVMPTSLVGSEWASDRIRDIEWVNGQLVRLGVIPAA